MKQSITKEQWDEVIDGTERHTLSYDDIEWSVDKLPTIGQMIEFLGDDLDYIVNDWSVYAFKKEVFEAKELVDALWEAVKNKLNTKD